MKELKEAFTEIYRKQPGLFRWMLGLLAVGVGLLVYSVMALEPGGAVVKVGYGDVSGYRDGAWTEILSFGLLALILGVAHNVLIVKIYARRGVGMAKVVAVCSIILVLMAGLTLMRIVGEG